MTAEELVDEYASPGPKRLFGTNSSSNKLWREDADIVQNAEPLSATFAVAAAVWTWTHNLGFKPLVMAFDSSFEQIFPKIRHVSDNQLQAEHLSNIAGYLIIR